MNQIVFNSENYKNNEELMADVGKIMSILTKNNNKCVFYYEDCGIYILQHDHSDVCLAESVNVWLTQEEYENYALGYFEVPSEDVWSATRESDCIEKFFHDKEEAYGYIEGYNGYVTKVEFEDEDDDF